MKKMFVFLALIFLISLVSSLPNDFDWSNVNGTNWITPVKDQASCGACWAFTSVGVTEAMYNIERNDSNFDLDLSEQHLVSNYSSAGNCDGGSALTIVDIRDKGVVDEECFKYQSQNSNMDKICSSPNGGEWKKRLWNIKSYGGIKWDDKEAIKQALIEHGPMYYAIQMSGEFINGVYSNCFTGGNSHTVVLVGYNESGNYWIAKNSWGESWNGDGYFKIDYNTCSPRDYLIYVGLDKNLTYQTNANSILPLGVGNISDIQKKDDKKINLFGASSADVFFDLSKQSEAEKIFLMINQKKVNNVSMNLDYCGNNYNFTIQGSEKIARFNLCDNLSECNQIINCGLNVTYRGESSSNLLLDLLILEGVYTHCKSNLVNVSSEWQDEGECRINDTIIQNRTTTQYDANNCEGVENQTFVEKRDFGCDYCAPNLVNTSWSEWENNICSGDKMNQSRYRIEYDSNNCYALTGLESDYFENITHYESQLINPILQYTPLSKWENSGECAGNSQTQIRTATEYDLNACAENQTIQEEREIICGNLNLEINSGWNLLSIPYSGGLSPAEMKDITNGAIYDNQIWLYSPNGISRADVNQKILPGIGFRVYSSEKVNISLPGDFMFSNKNLIKGWNMLGTYAVEQNLNDIIGNCSIGGGVWYWNSEEQKYEIDENKILPGKGIWLYALNNCTLYQNNPREGRIESMNLVPPGKIR